ncbi:uncharacterized protein V2V93DRAFT_376004 [Kockiozyma suomiensis]|uniref:uncharacterized protein n=1 Tax=Kockiozyma suomiensis TaxID=1337062 RepID=UPI00334425B8
MLPVFYIYILVPSAYAIILLERFEKIDTGSSLFQSWIILIKFFFMWLVFAL